MKHFTMISRASAIRQGAQATCAVFSILAGLLASFVIQAADSPSTGAGAGSQRIGIYDSRALAYAQFWSAGSQSSRQQMVRAAKDAKTAGDTAKFRKLDAQLKKVQEQSHLQVFSTAPVDDVLADMKDIVAAVQNETGVSKLVSKWDTKTLDQNRGAERVDVTDRLLATFKLSEKQRKVVSELRQKEPLPLSKAERLMKQGKL